MPDFPIGFKKASNDGALAKRSMEDRSRSEAVQRLRNSKAALGDGRAPMDVVMIFDKTGMTHDIRTGTPPKMKREYLEELERRRQEIGIEGLFK
jgi:hypothetical protein